jgi:PAS domain S-box-containing protein
MSAVAVRENGVVVRYEGMCQDITESRRMEAALREAEQKYRGIFDKAIIGIYQCSPDGRFLSVNPAMAHTFGYDSPEEMMTSITDLSQQFFVDLRRRAQFMLTMDRVEGVKNFECEVFRKDGVKIWLTMSILAIRENGTVVRCEGMSEDITRRKQMESALREAELNYRGIFDKAVVGIFQSTPEGRFLSVNPAMALAIGYDSPDEMVASITDIATQFYVDPKRREEFKSSMEQLDAAQNIESAMKECARTSPSASCCGNSFFKRRNWNRWASLPPASPTKSIRPPSTLATTYASSKTLSRICRAYWRIMDGC